MDLFGRGIQQPTSKQTSSLSTIQFLWCQFEEFGIESIFNPQIDIFVFHITSTLVVHWSCKKKFCLGQVKNNDLVLPHLSFLQAWSCEAFCTSLGPTWAFLIEDLFMESGFLLPAGCNPSYSIRFVQNYVKLLNKPQMAVDILLLTWDECLKVHQGTGICLAVEWCVGQHIL